MSSGTRTLLTEVLFWGALAFAAVWLFANYDNVKSTAANYGLEVPEDASLRNARRLRGTDGAQNTHKPVGYVELDADRYGHYRTALEVNGRRIDAMVDTGATMVALSHEDARRAGIMLGRKDYTHRVRTANGIAKVAPVTLTRVRLGDIIVRNVRGVVSEPGAMKGTLLGMSFLSRLSRFEIRSGRLILQE